MFFQDIYKDFFGQCFDMQKKVLDVWQDSFLPKEEKKESQQEKMINDAVKKPMEGFQQWTKAMNEMFTKNMKFFGGSSVQESFAKITSSNSFYHSLYSLWEDLMKQTVTNTKKQIDEFFGEWKKEYSKVFADHFVGYFPEPTQGFVKDSIENYEMYTTNMKKFVQPWTENTKEFQKLIGTNIFENKDVFLNYSKLFKGNYEETFGKFFSMPAMGINREYFEKQTDSIDAFMKYTNTLGEFSGVIFKVGIDTMEKIIKDMKTMVKNENQPKTFKEFYEYWWRKNEEAYTDLFATDEFSKLLSQVVDAGIHFKKNYDGLLEMQLSFLPFPTKTDMNSLYKTIYDLKKTVRNTNKELRELKNKMNEKTENK
ncbi:MAG: hypothetical protein N4A62_14225 [Marinisporobacter sp.]|jgi:class III poly(R)-hydroxyalkanoic acid synthase PhaE subunit|nr:hypothetical protein [Marinisporobacter sp.]